MKYILENGIIDLAYVQEQIEMNKKEEILKMHPYKMWEGKDGKWYTHIKEDDLPRKKIKRKTEEELKTAIISYYEKKEKERKKKEEEEKLHITFNDAYFSWRSVQDKLVKDNTISKYDTDYKRYFENTDFSKTEIQYITEETIKVFITDTVKSKKLGKKACKTLFGYIRNVIKSALINHFIKENPVEFLEAKNFYKYCTEKKRPMTKVLVSNKEMEKLYQQFQSDYKKKPFYIPTYAVEFASLTGMRVSEISALTWDCITDEYIIINKSEKYNRKTKEYFIGDTKNCKERVFPITKEIKELLERLKKVEIKYGFICEWVFANENGRIHAPIISSCSKNKCRQVGIDEKGIHAYRRTVNSMLRCDGVSATVAASLLGHTEEVNEQYYTFDVSDMEEKIKIISKINSEMPIAK